MIIIIITFIPSLTLLFAQNSSSRGHTIVDEMGVIRWTVTNKEVEGFGVNYSVPFAHAYRSAIKLNVDPKEAIDRDIYHFTKLGFDLYRLHVWDTEISDTLGNLLVNEHLDTFDYLIAEIRKRGFNYVLTPIAFWGNGWPEPDEDTPGFSNKYGKGDCLTDPDCISAQQNYLKQFIEHVNPYTGIAYKDDQHVIAFEVSNEPHHRGEASAVTAFVSGMVNAIRSTGTEKPVFYNTSHGVHFAQAYFDGGIDGGTFQWYPTGLGYQREIPGNVLPNVNDYGIPFDSTFRKNGGAKLVYEFDAADVGKSYLYPVIARSFREAGIQIATHFAYDPTYLAPFNTEYNTHYMNLAYTPSKALGLMIAGKVFHEFPLYGDAGSYPQNLRFGNVAVDYQKDLATYINDDTFIYTNSNNTEPNLKKLKHVAGYGNSKVIQYNGLGAYFLDQLDKNTWRLEIMPDAIWVRNPFGRNSLDKTVGVVKWAEQTMTIEMEQVGSDFTIEPVNENNSFQPEVKNKSFAVKPGVYLVSRKNKSHIIKETDSFGFYSVNTYVAPVQEIDNDFFNHEQPVEVSEDSPLTLKTTFVGQFVPDSVDVLWFSSWRPDRLKMTTKDNYHYEVEIPAEKVISGYAKYNIRVHHGEQSIIYPAGKEGNLYDWDFYDRESYEIRVVPKDYSLVLFEPESDAEFIIRPWRRGIELKTAEYPYQAEYQVNIDQLFRQDNENLNAPPIYDYTFKHSLIGKIKYRESDLEQKSKLVVVGRSLKEVNQKIQVAFVLDNGASFGSIIELTPEITEVEIDLESLQPVKTITLPRPYPSFLPYYFNHELSTPFDINRIEFLQLSVGPGLDESQQLEKQGYGIMNIRLE